MSEERELYAVEPPLQLAYAVTVWVEETHLLWADDAEEAKREVLTSRGARITIARHPVGVVKVEEAR